MSKFYAVRNGRMKGIFLNWPDCKAQVDKYKDAKYKSFESIAEAAQFLVGGSPVQEDITVDSYYAFVDGSYNPATKNYSSGVLILKGDDVVDKISKMGGDTEAASMRNVAGEILGAELAIQYALAHGYKKFTVFHDYTGISEWADGYWKTNNKYTKKYAAYVAEARKTCDITFVKVKGHSGHKYNDMADALAKEALGLIVTNF